MLGHLVEIARHAGEITQHAVGGAVDGAAGIATNAAEIADIVLQSTTAAGGEVTERGLAMAGDAVKVAADAAKSAGDAAGATSQGAANIVGGAASISIEASKFAGGAAEGSAKVICEAASRIAAAAAGGVINEAAEATETIAKEAGKIAGEATKLAGEAGTEAVGGAALMAGEAANILAEASRLPGGATDVVADNVRSTASHLAFIGDAINTGRWFATTAGSAIFRNLTHPDALLETARSILRDGGDAVTRDLINLAITRALALIAPEELLQRVVDVFQRVKDNGAVRNLVFAVTRRTFSALGPYLGSLPAIYKGIFSNPVNWETLQMILKNRAMLARFIIDLVEPAKGFALDSSRGGAPRTDKEECQRYNELNMNDPMNRHALICQLQRLAKSVVAILEKGAATGEVEENALGTFDMDTVLETDSGGDLGKSEHMDKHDEQWFFVNGIGGEPCWVRLACKKLEDKYKRKVEGIFNRSDGLLWDIFECAGERDSGAYERDLIQRTRSSREAKDRLKSRLEQVLWPETGQTPPKVVMIAHSQGCLVLRLALEDLIEARREKPELENMKRLYVFTFGNPSLNWPVDKYCAHTEHFANRTDFVAGLGVLRGTNGYEGQRTFVNETWTGHLFGSQYSLEPGDYGVHGGDSRLLRRADGEAIDH
ncbi:uncharacterized protein DNG_09157 [Cephalotrichum gorgonifer]|uniref:DUF676 domain-containing protein n=1 Tax=Cephalotrichum gorgonifer TaxID=2041049 RepID=A0AAE8SZW5_9PEZI|nr:uncharacterized protein DNG_09157 [Cephalotrichum gorgonifer]